MHQTAADASVGELSPRAWPLRTALRDLPVAHATAMPRAGLRRNGGLPASWSPDRAYAWIFLFGTLLRVAILLPARHVPFVSDAGDYVDAARLLMSGQHFVPFWPPGLPLYLMPFLAAGASGIALRATMLFFWMVACWGILRLARATGVGCYAWLLLLVFSLMPSSIQMAIETQTQEPVAAMLLIALGSAVLCGQGAGWGEFFLLGGSLGWMALMRPSSLPLLVLLPAVCLLVQMRGGSKAAGYGASDATAAPASFRRWGGPVLSVVLSLAMVGCWMLRAHELCGAWIINNSNAANVYYANNPWTPLYKTWYFGTTAKLGSEEIRQFPEYERVLLEMSRLPSLEASKQYNRMAFDYIKQRPDLFVLRTLNRVRCFFGFDTFTSTNLRRDGAMGRRLFPACLALEAFFYMIVAGCAFFWLAMAGAGFWRRWQSWLIACAIVVYSAPYWLTMSHPTYHYPVVMPLAILGLMAWNATVGEAGLSARSWMRGWIAVAVLCAIQVEWISQMAGSLRK